MRSGPGRGRHPHSAPGRLGDAGYLYHQPAQKYPGHSGLQPGGNVLYAFPTAQALAAAGEQALRDCALGYRAPYVLAAAQAVAAGTLDLAALETLPDARLLEALMQQHGVGIKVANCVALFAYGRMECAPVDVWIQRVIDQHYAGQNPFPAYGNAGILQQWMFYFARSEKERVK